MAKMPKIFRMFYSIIGKKWERHTLLTTMLAESLQKIMCHCKLFWLEGVEIHVDSYLGFVSHIVAMLDDAHVKDLHYASEILRDYGRTLFQVSPCVGAILLIYSVLMNFKSPTNPSITDITMEMLSNSVDMIVDHFKEARDENDMYIISKRCQLHAHGDVRLTSCVDVLLPLSKFLMADGKGKYLNKNLIQICQLLLLRLKRARH